MVVDGVYNPEPVPLHIPVVEPTDTDPVIDMVGLLAQTEISGPAATTGAPEQVITKVSFT